MQIVINIPKELYEANNRGLEAEEVWDLRVAVKNGIQLPKGHGRLIDAEEFHHTLEAIPIRDNDKWFNWLQKACNRLAEAPTIIEADNAESEEV